MRIKAVLILEPLGSSQELFGWLLSEFAFVFNKNFKFHQGISLSNSSCVSLKYFLMGFLEHFWIYRKVKTV